MSQWPEVEARISTGHQFSSSNKTKLLRGKTTKNKQPSEKKKKRRRQKIRTAKSRQKKSLIPIQNLTNLTFVTSRFNAQGQSKALLPKTFPGSIPNAHLGFFSVGISSIGILMSYQKNVFIALVRGGGDKNWKNWDWAKKLTQTTLKISRLRWVLSIRKSSVGVGPTKHL